MRTITAHGHHNHEPMIMILPLVVLAIGALLAGYLNWPKRTASAEFLGHSPSFAGYDAATAASIRHRPRRRSDRKQSRQNAKLASRALAVQCDDARQRR